MERQSKNGCHKSVSCGNKAELSTSKLIKTIYIFVNLLSRLTKNIYCPLSILSNQMIFIRFLTAAHTQDTSAISSLYGHHDILHKTLND